MGEEGGKGGLHGSLEGDLALGRAAGIEVCDVSLRSCCRCTAFRMRLSGHLALAMLWAVQLRDLLGDVWLQCLLP